MEPCSGSEVVDGPKNKDSALLYPSQVMDRRTKRGVDDDNKKETILETETKLYIKKFDVYHSHQ